MQRGTPIGVMESYDRNYCYLAFIQNKSTLYFIKNTQNVYKYQPIIIIIHIDSLDSNVSQIHVATLLWPIQIRNIIYAYVYIFHYYEAIPDSYFADLFRYFVYDDRCTRTGRYLLTVY